MHFSLDAKLLGFYLNTAFKAVSKRGPLPILSGFYVKADPEEKVLTITGTDLEKMITTSVPATIWEGGETVIPAKQFLDITKTVSGLLTVQTEKDSMKLSWGETKKGTMSLKTFKPEEFPEREKIVREGGTSFMVKGFELKTSLLEVIYACSLDENRPVMTGILFELRDKELTLVATDGHQLPVSKLMVETESEKEERRVLPGKTCKELLQLLDAEDVKVLFNESTVAFIKKDTTLVARVLEGEFPNYKQVIPQEGFNCIFKGNANSFKGMLNRGILIDKDVTVKLEIKESTLYLSASGEMGSIKEQMEIQQKGDDSIIHFNPSFLLNSLSLTDGEFVFYLTGKNSAGVLRPTDKENKLALVLPMYVPEKNAA